MSGFELRFEAPMRLLAALPCVLLVILFALRGRKAGRRPRRLTLVLRLVEIALACVILAGLSLSVFDRHAQRLILLDGSDSVSRASVQAGAEELMAQMEPGTLRGVIDFAEEPGALRAADAEPSALDTGATDIAAALAAAADALGEEQSARVTLVTDGVATDGDALAAAGVLAARGIPVDALYVAPRAIEAEAETVALAMPESALAGQRVSATVTVRAGGRMTGTLRLYDGETPVWQEAATVLAGENALTVDLYAAEAGEHVFRAQFDAETDTIPENNAAYACMRVSDAARVLLVDGTGSEASRLSALLSGAGYAVDIVSGAALPQEMSSLSAYSLVVLMNVNMSDLPQGSAERLASYVQDYGRSLLTTGGENTYIYGGMQDTALEAALPVTVGVSQEQSAEPVALMLVIDTTDSMTRGLDVGTPMDMARQGAAACVQSLHVNDFAGIITFADDAQVLVEMTPMAQRESVLGTIAGIETADASRLTRFSDALRLACDELTAFDGAQKKHVLFITDGSPVDAGAGFEATVKEMRRNGITLSAIAVGRMVNVRKLLENLATLGGGRCYGVDSAYDLPQIMFTDTVLLQVEYTAKGAFTPVIGTRVFPIRDENAVDQIYGYIRTTVKPDAQVALSAPDGSPVYAQWRYGEGVAASFMSDLSGDWSHNWLVSEDGKRLVLDMLESLIPGTLGQGGAGVTLASGGKSGVLTVRGGPEEAQSLRVAITAPDGSSQDVLMHRDADGAFVQTIALPTVGCYAAALTWLDGADGTLDAQDALFTHSWTMEYEALSQPDGRAALSELCAATGGVLADDPQALARLDAEGTARETDAVLLLSLLLYVCLMAELIVKKRVRA